jgi:hypothetical protein
VHTERSGAILSQLQSLLAGIYDVPIAYDVAEFLLTDRTRLPQAQGANLGDEQVLVASDPEALEIGVFLEPQVLERLTHANPIDALHGGNLADYWTALEGVSHFIYLAFNAIHDRPVSLLELELQAEIDKYVGTMWLLRAQDPIRFPAEVHNALFVRAHVDVTLAGARIGLYRQANDYAARFCRHLSGTLRSRETGARALAVAELRRFYRLSEQRKVRHIERTA